MFELKAARAVVPTGLRISLPLGGEQQARRDRRGSCESRNDSPAGHHPRRSTPISRAGFKPANRRAALRRPPRARLLRPPPTRLSRHLEK